jgi:hypothetical protein
MLQVTLFPKKQLMANLKQIIDKYASEILELSANGVKKADIARSLIDSYSLEIPSDKFDSFRRGISKFIEDNEDAKLQQELSTPLAEDENELASKVKNDFTESELKDIDSADQDNDEEDEEDYDELLKDASEHKDKYWYISETDTYFVVIPGYNGPLKFSGTLIRELKNMYSYLGREGGLTINQVCRAVKLPRRVIICIKTYMGWTHDSDPYTNEEMLTGDIDEMVDRSLEDKKFQWFQKYTRKEQKMIEDAANKWWQMKGTVINPFVEKMIKEMKEYHARPVKKLIKGKGDPHALVIGPFDLHFGKYAWEGDTGSVYNREKAKTLLLESTDNIIKEVTDKNIDKVIIPVGSDFFHVDTINGTTTRGTPQDTDGNLVQIMVEGNQLMIEFVERLRAVADVELILTAGNHDYVLSHQLIEVLAAYYRECKDVSVTRCYHFRQYALYGKTLLGFTHGDETKLPDLPLLMATEAKEMWAQAEHKAFFTGHLHHEMSKDHKGVKVYQMPSLAGTDRWHHKKGYVGSVKGLAAYLVHADKGVRITVMENV